MKIGQKYFWKIVKNHQKFTRIREKCKNWLNYKIYLFIKIFYNFFTHFDEFFHILDQSSSIYQYAFVIFDQFSINFSHFFSYFRSIFTYVSIYPANESSWNNYFSRSKSGKTTTSSLPTELWSWFLDMLYNFKFSIDWINKKQFFRFLPFSTPSPKLEHEWILTQGRSHSFISDSTLN